MLSCGWDLLNLWWNYVRSLRGTIHKRANVIVYSDIIGVHIVIYYVRTRNHYQIIIVGCTGAGSDKFITATLWLQLAVKAQLAVKVDYHCQFMALFGSDRHGAINAGWSHELAMIVCFAPKNSQLFHMTTRLR